MNLPQKPVDIILYIEQNFTRAQANGLNALVFLAMREQTSVAYQQMEWGFTDIPQEIIALCDSLDEYHLVFLGVEIASWLLGGKKATILAEAENAQTVAVQAIEPQSITPLLSDY